MNYPYKAHTSIDMTSIPSIQDRVDTISDYLMSDFVQRTVRRIRSHPEMYILDNKGDIHCIHDASQILMAPQVPGFLGFVFVLKYEHPPIPGSGDDPQKMVLSICITALTGTKVKTLAYRKTDLATEYDDAIDATDEIMASMPVQQMTGLAMQALSGNTPSFSSSNNVH